MSIVGDVAKGAAEAFAAELVKVAGDLFAGRETVSSARERVSDILKGPAHSELAAEQVEREERDAAP